MPFPRASAICVCAKSHARCPSTSLVLLFPSLPSAPYTTFPRALTLHVCSARYLRPPPYVPCVSARHLLCPSLAFPTSFCHLCLRKISCALPQHVISPSLPLASMCAVYNIPSRTHTEPAPQCRTWPQHLGRINNCAWLCPACAGASSIHVCATLSEPHNFFLGLAFSSPLSSPHADATRACPTLGWPLSAYKPACAFLYTTDSPVACGVRVCKLLPCSNLSLPFPFATCLRHACLLYPRPAFVFLQALHSPRATLQPSSHVPIVSVRRLVRLSLAFTRFCHSCLPDTWLLFVLDTPPWADKCHKV